MNTHKDHDLESPKEKARKERNSWITLGVIVLIVIIVIASIIIFSRSTVENEVVYNGYKFERFEGNKWMTQQQIKGQLYNIPFYYHPQETLDIITDRTTVDLVRAFMKNPNGTIYITVDPDESSKIVIAGVEYARILGKSYDIYNFNVKSGLIKESNVSSSAPIITCKNQTKDTVVIYQYVGEKNDIRRSGYCIILESKDVNESIRVADAFAFNLLNIIQ